MIFSLSLVVMTGLGKCCIRFAYICSGYFTQVSEPWPVGLLFFFLPYVWKLARSSLIMNFRVMSPWLLKKPMFDFVISITRLVLIRSSWNLQIKWTWMKSWIISITVQVKLFSSELLPLYCWKRLFSTLSSAQLYQFLSDLPEPYV